MAPATPVEDLAEVRARLERMVEIAEEAEVDHATEYLGTRWWTEDYLTNSDVVQVRWGGMADKQAAFIAAASPDLLLRVAQEAFGVLDRHAPMDGHPSYCSGCESEIPIYPPSWPCLEVKSVLRAWQP